jgi:hypothetical protein
VDYANVDTGGHTGSSAHPSTTAQGCCLLLGPATTVNATVKPYSGPRPYVYSYDYGQRDLETAEPLRRYAQDEDETRGVAGHNLSGYRHRGCRCPICVEAKVK